MIPDTRERSVPPNVRKIPAFSDDQRLGEDLDALIRMMRDDGASQAAIVNVEDISFDPGIKTKAEQDNAFASIHWPLDYPKDDILEAVAAYRKGLFFQILPDAGLPAYGGGPISDENHRKLYFKVADIVSRTESAAFYLGYHLVIGLGTGNCRSIFCADEKRCAAMIRGKKCIHPYKGRPSLEAVGIDARALAGNLNFTLPTGDAAPLLAGLVLIT